MYYYLGPDDDASTVRTFGKAKVNFLQRPTAPTELVCVDLQGNTLWQRSGLRAMASLPNNRFLVSDHGGAPQIIDGDGCELCRGNGLRGIERAMRHGNLLALRYRSTLRVTDLDLRPIDEIHWPRGSPPTFYCFVDGAFRWVAGKKLWMRPVLGEPQSFASLPWDLVQQEATGRSRLGYQWEIAFDEDEGVYFLSNTLPPHILVCLDRQGNANWCRYISPACCGGVGYRLPSGLCVTSSGCGGILTWLDLNGNILFQSDPPSPGLASAYSNVVTVLSDGRSLVWGLQGLTAFDQKGELLWRAKLSCSEYQVCEERGILIGCRWSNRESEASTVAVLEAVGDL